ncbi:hypothetical protein ACFFRS_27210, partial [Saccharopolyspora hordei]|uniref:hypothetical protein n=1 Tax=Saccharopolyspora hordei TaxID=1838 RepID=UPI0035EF8C3D
MVRAVVPDSALGLAFGVVPGSAVVLVPALVRGFAAVSVLACAVVAPAVAASPRTGGTAVVGPVERRAPASPPFGSGGDAGAAAPTVRSSAWCAGVLGTAGRGVVTSTSRTGTGAAATACAA